MVIDKLRNAHLYYCLGANFEKGLKFIEENADKVDSLATGRQEIDGDNVYAIIRRYETKPKAEVNPETHKKYADIQFLAQGAEVIGYVNIDGITGNVEDKPENDVYYHTAETTFFKISDGLFTILLPEDAHQPDCAIDDIPAPVTKIVIKVKI